MIRKLMAFSCLLALSAFAQDASPYLIVTDTDSTGIDPDLLVWYEFDNDVNPQPDSTANGYDGTVVNATWSSTNGGVMVSDGTIDYVENASFDLAASASTHMIWVKTTDTTVSRLFLIQSGSNYRNLSLVSGKLNAYDGSHGYAGTAAVNNGTWHHVAATYDTNEVIMYIDGAHDKTTTAAWDLHAFVSSTLRVSDDGLPSINGLLDDARIYQRKLTLTEISNIYDATKTTYGL